MIMKGRNLLKINLLFSLLTFSTLGFSQTAILTGKITDAATGEVLGYTTVSIPALSLGAIADGNGVYRIANIPAGEYVVKAAYTGFAPIERKLTFKGGETLEENFVLGESAVSLENVVISAQAIGQQAAINQQIASNTIVNVISKEKLQELPDQNAAEALGRLSGVAVQRDGGEGQKVVIRGLSPRFASVTVNGERIPSTDGNDRSVDLSMVSPDMLSGVELFKAIRPDMDGDAVGGTVNFTVKKADKDFQGDVRLFGGYNGLREMAGPFRASTTLSNRFFKNKVGLLFTGNFQRADRSSENLESNYYFGGINPRDSSKIISRVGQLTLSDQIEQRERSGASLTADYTFKNGFVILNSFWGRTFRDVLRYRNVYNPRDGGQDYSIRESEQSINLLANSLSGEHNMGKFTLNWRGSYSQTDQQTPYSLEMRVRDNAARLPNVIDDQGPGPLVQGFKNDYNSMIIWDTRRATSDVGEYNATGQLDLKHSFVLTSKINGYLKTGGKYRQQGRSRDNNQNFLRPYLGAENVAVRNPNIFIRNRSGQALMANVLGDYNNPKFLGGEYPIAPGQSPQFALVTGDNVTEYNNFWGTNYKTGDTIRYGRHLDMDKVRRFYDRFQGEYRPDLEVEAEDYDGLEQIGAGYLMGEFNIGSRMMLMGGVRYENTQQSYTSKSATAPNDPDDPTFTGQVVNTEASQGYDEWMPMLHLRYKFTSWLDVRLAATKTLNRPDFFNLVPWQRINPNAFSISRGKPDLFHTTTWNYDAFAYIYNKYGLFTAGVFFKQLDNIDVIRNSRIAEGKFNGYSLTEPINLPGTSKVQGLEIDFQSNLRPLPKGWNGIIVGANVTLVRSNTFVPFFDVQNRFIPVPPFFQTVVTDTVRAGRVPGQANVIANVQLGYEIRGFSGRVSWNYQDNSLNRVGTRAEFDAFTDKAIRWDIAMQQRISRHWSAFLNLNNITNQPEAAFIGGADFPSEREFFGMTGEVGVRYKW